MDECDEVEYSVGVSHLVVVPGDEFDEGVVELDAGGGVEDGGALVTDEV